MGYTEEQFGIYNKGECIIFDDFTMDAKYVTFPFKVKSSAIKILTAKPNVNLRFIFECLQSMDLKSDEHKRHYISEIATLVIAIPMIEIQNHIACIIDSIDCKLTVEQQVAKEYEIEKLYLLSNMNLIKWWKDIIMLTILDVCSFIAVSSVYFGTKKKS